MVRVTKNPRIRLLDQAMPLVVVSRRKVAFMAIPGDLCDRTMVCNHHRLAVERLSELGDEKLAGSSAW